MTPDELICTTCEGEGAVEFRNIWGGYFMPFMCKQPCLNMPVVPWCDYRTEVDACPECGRGGEVGRL